jgi:hypothetical protein
MATTARAIRVVAFSTGSGARLIQYAACHTDFLTRQFEVKSVDYGGLFAVTKRTDGNKFSKTAELFG